ncbi:MAG: alpha/beta hydrolase [Ignavibacteriaceae bacterium]
MKKLLLMFIFAISFNYTAIFPQSSIIFTKSGNGQPLIFLPALGCKGRVWDNTVNELSKKYTCYEVSIAGFGGVFLDDKFSIEKISKDIINLIKQEKLQHPVLIGHSVSGLIALKTASENRGVFSKLIIVDSFPFALASIYPTITEEQAKQQGAMLKNMLLKESKEKFENTEKKNLEKLISNENDIDTVLSWFILSDREAIAEATSEMLSTDLRDSIKNIKCKTLIIGTWKGKEQLGFTKEVAEKIFTEQYKNINSKRIIISNDSKHFIMLDTPEWLNKQITGFITE